VKKACDGCGWSAEESPLVPLDIIYGRNGRDGDLFYHLHVCDDCHDYHKRTGEDPRYRYLRADRGAMAKRINGLRARIAELEWQAMWA
jgi:hypothetical protein